MGSILARNRIYLAVIVAAAALPRAIVLGYERGSILTEFVEKSDDFASTWVSSGAFGFIPNVPSAYTQPLYGWFLAALYWPLSRNWFVVGTAQIAVAVATALLVYVIGSRLHLPACRVHRRDHLHASPLPRLARRSTSIERSSISSSAPPSFCSSWSWQVAGRGRWRPCSASHWGSPYSGTHVCSPSHCVVGRLSAVAASGCANGRSSFSQPRCSRSRRGWCGTRL